MIALLSDSHDNEETVAAAVKIIRSRAPTHVIHCGDLVSPHMLQHFEGLPMHMVFGNNETMRDEINECAISRGFAPVDDELELVIDKKWCYIYHGTREFHLVEQIVRGGYDYVFHGHTHRVRNELIGNTRVINPGALHRTSAYSIAFLEPATGDLEFVRVVTTETEQP